MQQQSPNKVRESFEEWWVEKSIFRDKMKFVLWLAFADGWTRALKSEKAKKFDPNG